MINQVLIKECQSVTKKKDFWALLSSLKQWKVIIFCANIFNANRMSGVYIKKNDSQAEYEGRFG